MQVLLKFFGFVIFLNQHSASLDKQDIFTDKPRVIILKYVHTIDSYKTDKGIVDIEFMIDNVSNDNGNLCKGDKVFINNQLVPDGKYTLSSSSYFNTENGIVKHISLWVVINGINEKYKV